MSMETVQGHRALNVLNSSRIKKIDISNAVLIEFECLCKTYYSFDYLFQLKGKNKELKKRLRKLEDLNANLQQELLSAKRFMQLPSARSDESNQEIIQTLKNRIVPTLSEDEENSSLIFYFESFLMFHKKYSIYNV